MEHRRRPGARGAGRPPRARGAGWALAGRDRRGGPGHLPAALGAVDRSQRNTLSGLAPTSRTVSSIYEAPEPSDRAVRALAASKVRVPPRWWPPLGASQPLGLISPRSVLRTERAARSYPSRSTEWVSMTIRNTRGSDCPSQVALTVTLPSSSVRVPPGEPGAAP